MKRYNNQVKGSYGLLNANELDNVKFYLREFGNENRFVIFDGGSSQKISERLMLLLIDSIAYPVIFSIILMSVRV